MPGTDALIMDPEIVPTITAILSIHTRLFALQSLVPSPEVNGLFEDLMTICLRPIPNARSSRILSDPRIVEILPALHQLCSLSEFEMEKYWCKRITDSSNPNEELRKFTYFENYVDLTRLELAAIYALDTNPINNWAVTLDEHMFDGTSQRNRGVDKKSQSWFYKLDIGDSRPDEEIEGQDFEYRSFA
ncbi:putative Nicotianamine synthase 1 [Glarea lozoyensis 74030]|uniref:Putative Nicotianamine synthase 1 n=1 Tax=Glarea lozoyensis (strain ATCC 74030 / MF5533) TaxID=1104152 RepID=H0EJ00_GLAL7|nr:putative Nicotianamine synthase 1 [Glarea lozoyensis 74030]